MPRRQGPAANSVQPREQIPRRPGALAHPVHAGRAAGLAPRRALPLNCPEEIAHEAQRIAAQLVRRGQRNLAARQRLPLSRGQPRTHPPVRSRRPRRRSRPGPGGRSRLQSVMDEDGMELRLDCYSNARKKTEGRHHRALRGMFRGRTAEAARRAVASPHPLWRRRCPAADRPEPREEPWHRAALHGRCHHRSGQGRRTPMRENAAGAWDEEIDCGGWHLEEFER